MGLFAACSCLNRRPLQLRLSSIAAMPSYPTPTGSVAGSRRWLSTEDDSHDDFKPQVKGGAAAGVKDTIEKDIAGHDVFIYMKVRGG